MKDIKVIGMDLAKHVFQIHGQDSHGTPVVRRKLRRNQVLVFFSNLRPCIVGMEACAGSNYWARELEKLGHTVRIMPAQYVKPYVKTNKNDAADAEAIAEAVTRPNMRFVPIKPVENQDIQSIHRIRLRLVRNLTALGNEIRGLLNEYGIIIPQGLSALEKELHKIFENDASGLTPLALRLFHQLATEFQALRCRVKEYDGLIEEIMKTNPVCKRISSVPGVGPITATAIVAAVPNPAVFRNGRQFSAWLGLVPKQQSSGGKERPLGISKRGDGYLRMLLIHGSRSSVYRSNSSESYRAAWLRGIKERRGFNRACVAMANKNARIIWSLLRHGDTYQENAA